MVATLTSLRLTSAGQGQTQQSGPSTSGKNVPHSITLNAPRTRHLRQSAQCSSHVGGSARRGQSAVTQAAAVLQVPETAEEVQTPAPARMRNSSTATGLGWSRELHEHVQVLASQVLGEGTSGTVVLGVERATSRHVAVKILRKQARPGRSAARHVLKKIADEVELLEQLQGCPRVVRLVGKFEDDESAYVVTELCSEGDLGYFTESFEFSEVDAAFMARDLLAVLAECHARNIAHCDIKPENFMVSTAPCGMRSLKAVDFGCGQVVRDGYPLREKTGTPIYRAPEMYQRMYGLEADLWAAGMIIYALLCGRLCFWDCLEECTPESVMDSILNAEVSYEHDIWASVSPAAADLVRSLLQRDPALRISAREALENEWIVSNCGPTSLSFVESEDDDRSIESPSFVNNVVPTPAGALSKKVNK